MRVSPGRIYVLGDRRNAGKTVVSMGLLSLLAQRSLRVHYMKPTSQLGLDSELMKRVCPATFPVETNPVLLKRELVRSMLRGDRAQRTKEWRMLAGRIRVSFSTLERESDFVVLEGSGHSAVGDCIGLSNGDVAKLLNIPVLLVIEAGIGSALDQAALQIAYLRSKKVRIAGVVLNFAEPDKKAELAAPVARGLEKWGIPLLGIIPLDKALSLATVREIFNKLSERFSGEARGDLSVPVASAADSAIPLSYLLEKISARSLLVVAGSPSNNRKLQELIRTPRARDNLAGIIYLGERVPSFLGDNQGGLPFLSFAGLSIDRVLPAVQGTILRGNHKIHPDDAWRIAAAQKIVTGNLSLDSLIG